MMSGGQDFWTWFATAGRRLADKLDDRARLNQLDRRLRRELGEELGWEVGPWGDICYLAISPQGDRSLIGKAEAFVARAPQLPGWKILVGCQKKEFADDQVTMELPSLGVVDVGKWLFWLEKSDIPPRVKVVVYPEGSEDASAESLIGGAEIVLDGLLGEMTRMSQIDTMVVTRSVVGKRHGIRPLDLLGCLQRLAR